MEFLYLCLESDVSAQLTRAMNKETAGITQRFLRNQGNVVFGSSNCAVFFLNHKGVLN